MAKILHFLFTKEYLLSVFGMRLITCLVVVFGNWRRQPILSFKIDRSEAVNYEFIHESCIFNISFLPPISLTNEESLSPLMYKPNHMIRMSRGAC